MLHLAEALKIEILMMIGFGERMRTQTEIAALFQAHHPDLPPLNQSIVNKGISHEKDLIMYTKIQHIFSIRMKVVQQLEQDKTVLKILKLVGSRLFKMKLVHRLLDNSDRRMEFHKSMMNLINCGQTLPD
ncbi:hypothetical protein ABEB36_014293 [Hypothenemus hampei]|uniref:Uncharacterized protein n=1 Tax=Hypothenemus hampei TaxID=57062 RepID=A0ABD1E4V7_HYPHA